MAKKKAEKGHYARERDAKAAAIKQGLKEDEFEIVYGPKGFSVRIKNKYVPVEGAKLHGIGQPDSGEQEPVEANIKPTSTPNVFVEEGSGRYRYSDETHDLSQESYETESQAKIALDSYVKNILGPVQEDANSLGGHPHDPDDTIIGEDDNHPDPQQLDDEDDEEMTPEEAPNGTEDIQPKNPPIAEMLGVLKQHLGDHPKTESRACACKQIVPTWINGAGVLCYIEHTTTGVGLVTDNQHNVLCSESEEPVKNVPISIKVSELPIGAAAIVTTTSENRVVGGTTPSTRLTKSTIPDPSKAVWHIADQMFTANPATARKDVIKACVEAGIAYFTARTQFQQWSQARRESIQHAAEANAKKE